MAQGYDAQTCGKMNMGYGPFDYRKSTQADRELVEKFHFTPRVEALLDGASTMKSELGADIAYLLHAFPNHPRGLLAMWRLSDQRKLDPPPRVPFTVACYFERGLNLAKDDTVVRALYASFLASRNRKADALAQLKIATHFAAENPISHHNIGLVYLDLKEPDLALEQAHKAPEDGHEQFPGSNHGCGPTGSGRTRRHENRHPG
ncbi:MAG: ABC transporter permease [Rubrivivax sp.]|nr:ABC transporter permease [Rubrivivax sp.]